MLGRNGTDRRSRWLAVRSVHFDLTTSVRSFVRWRTYCSCNLAKLSWIAFMQDAGVDTRGGWTFGICVFSSLGRRPGAVADADAAGPSTLPIGR